MIIHCPQCQFNCEMPDENIPPHAKMATCPKCHARFQFRQIQEDTLQETPTQSQDTSADNTQEKATPQASQQKQDITQSSVSNEPVSQYQVRNNFINDSTTAYEDNSVDDKTVSEQASTENQSSTVHEKKVSLDIPWENISQYGFINALYQTAKRVICKPTHIFSVISSYKGSIKPAILFYLIFGIIQSIAKLFWFQQALGVDVDPQMQGMFGISSINLGLSLLIAPALLYIQLYFYSGLFWLMFKLVQPERVEFNSVLRVIAYSSSVMFLCFVPIIGTIVATIWFAVICFIGCKIALRLTWSKTAIAILPLYAIALSINVQILRQLF